jgi:phosphoglycolate/pyridoxal phosphate phosphatase family enzyme
VRVHSKLSKSKSLSSLKVVVLDLDGVVYRGKTTLPGAPESIAWLRDQGLRVYFLTNNSTQTRASYVARLTSIGIPCCEEEVFSSAYACAIYFGKPKCRAKDGGLPRVLVIGEGGLAGELKRGGIHVVRPPARRDLVQPKVDYVVVGMDRKITYAKLYAAQQAIVYGARFVASNRDPVYPVEHGIIPGGGSIVAAIEAAGQQKPVLIGKPSPYILKLLLEQAGVAPEQALFVGDRLDTDIYCGKRTGTPTLLVLTGVTSRKEAEKAPERLRPDWIIDSIADLPKLLEKGRGRR